MYFIQARRSVSAAGFAFLTLIHGTKAETTMKEKGTDTEKGRGECLVVNIWWLKWQANRAGEKDFRWRQRNLWQRVKLIESSFFYCFFLP
jgi:hypothetical protein